ncbi:hypothetical protein JTE90_026258 [Oedothorax gibbosus]|uniref:Major facilitator superfamily (MFS) profile domain-containing protein n=1 Tax=Oedothorax gibbosus TaxID=931172 RepID=A0AAV6TVM6_9ARAC|nr:hypothetical protein JTE90_026258 [Oedothorax gibbosus]
MNSLNEATESTLVLDKRPEEKTPFFVYVVAGLAAVGGLLFGYDTGVVSGAMLLIRDYFDLNATMQGVVVSATIITAWFFCLLAGQLTDRYGRKIVIVAASVVFTAGSIMMGLANSVALLISGRVVVGIGIGKGFILFSHGFCL